MRKINPIFVCIIFFFFSADLFSQNQTGYFEDFSAAEIERWSTQNSKDSLEISDDKLWIKLDGDSPEHFVDYELSPIDMSSHTLLSFSVKSDLPLQYGVTLIDAQENVIPDFGVHIIPASDDQFFTMYHNFQIALNKIKNSVASEITKIRFVIYVISPEKKSNHIEIDNLAIGDEVESILSQENFLKDDSLSAENWSLIDNTYDSMTFNNGQMKLELNTDSIFRGILYTFEPTDLSGHPFVRLNLKSDINFNMNIYLINAYGNYTHYNKRKYVLADQDTGFTDHYLNFEDSFTQWMMDGLAPFDPSVMSTMFIEMFPDTAQDGGTVIIDEIEFGETVTIPEAEISGTTDDFNDNYYQDKWYETGAGHQLEYAVIKYEEKNEELLIKVNKNQWEKAMFCFDMIDMSENPYVSFKCKADEKMELSLFLWDYTGRYNTKNDISFMVEPSEDYQTYYFNFSGAFTEQRWNPQTLSPVDSTRITRLLFNFNPGGPYKGNVYFDDLKIGSDAERFTNNPPSVTQMILPDTINLKNGMVEVPLEGLSDGDGGLHALSFRLRSSKRSVIETPEVIYNQGEQEAILKLNPLKEGTSKITVTIEDAAKNLTNSGEHSFSYEHEIVVINAYQVTFQVNDNSGSPLMDAEIQLSGYGSCFTDENGTALFNGVKPEYDISYTVSADGYNDISKQLNVTEDDVSLKFSMGMVSISDLSGEKRLSVFPNPSDGKISVEGDIQPGSRMEIHDITGNLVLNKSVYNFINIEIPLPPGIYFLKIIDNQHTFLSKLIMK